MEIFENLVFEDFEESDVDILTPIMKRAFDRDMHMHTGEPEGGPPGYNNGNLLRKWYLEKDRKTSYKVSVDGKPIGGISIYTDEEGTNILSNIFIDPDCQEKGVGLSMWKFVETKHPASIWRTSTPAFSKRNHSFYVNKCGFAIVKITNPKSDFAIYELEKRRGFDY